MKEVVQEHELGCAVACTAALIGLTYQEALKVFPNGKSRAVLEGFYCRDIVQALRKANLDYTYRQVKGEMEIPLETIIYIKKSLRYPVGHFLARGEEGFMDPWINFPKYPQVAGFRSKLPGLPQYIVLPITSVHLGGVHGQNEA